MSGKQKELLLLAIVLLLALAVRLYLLAATNFVIDSDEAIVGLMAKHITEGKSWPVFYYGQAYMGSLEAVLAAGFFSFMGQSAHALKLVPLLFSLLHVLLVYLLARHFTSLRWAFAAAFLAAVAPNALVLWSGMARGGFVELVVLGSIALLCAVRILEQESPSPAAFMLLGFILGLGWWVNNQIIFYCAAVGVVFLLSLPRRMGLAAGARAAFLAGLAFVIGGTPFWWANVFHHPRLESFRVLFGNSAGGDAWKHLSGYFTTALPIIFGARRFWSEADIFPGASAAAYLIYGLLLLLFFWRFAVQKSKAALLLILVFLIVVPVIFSVSSFGWLVQAPRYLLPLYSVLFVVTALGLEVLWSGSRAGRVLSGGLFSGVLLLNLASNYWGGLDIPGQPFVYQGDRVAADQTVVYKWLRENGYRHIRTNYWIGYRTAFETGEEITFTRFGQPRSLRIPEYEQDDVQHGYEGGVYVLVPAEAKLFSRHLQQFGYSFRRSTAGPYMIFDRIVPRWPWGGKIHLRAEQIKTSSRQDWAVNMLDGRLETRWGSGEPQHPGMFVAVDFDNPQLVSGIELDLGGFTHDAPRGLVVEGRAPDGRSYSLFDLTGAQLFYKLEQQQLYEVEREWRIYFPPQQLSSLRIKQVGEAPVFDWSIAELTVFGAPESGAIKER